MKGLQIRAIIQCRWAKMEKKINVFEYATATRRAGVQWHPGNRPIVESNGHAGSLVN